MHSKLQLNLLETNEQKAKKEKKKKMRCCFIERKHLAKDSQTLTNRTIFFKLNKIYFEWIYNSVKPIKDIFLTIGNGIWSSAFVISLTIQNKMKFLNGKFVDSFWKIIKSIVYALYLIIKWSITVGCVKHNKPNLIAANKKFFTSSDNENLSRFSNTYLWCFFYTNKFYAFFIYLCWFLWNRITVSNTQNS